MFLKAPVVFQYTVYLCSFITHLDGIFVVWLIYSHRTPDDTNEQHRYDITLTLTEKMADCWVTEPCSLVEVNQRFRRVCCLHHQGDHPDESDSRTSESLVRLLPDYTAQQPRSQPSRLHPRRRKNPKSQHTESETQAETEPIVKLHNSSNCRLGGD
jgi:hypothetical protein